MDEYITGFPEDVRHRLRWLQQFIQMECPDAREAIQYGMPTFIWKGKALIHFGAYKNHIGVYPVPTKDDDWIKAFPGYKTSGRGTIKFPHGQQIPEELLRNIIQHQKERIWSNP